MGILAAIFMLLVAVTGVLLNHTEYFQFDSRHVKSGGVLDWYGIQAPTDLTSFVAGDSPVTRMGAHLYVGEQEIPGNYRNLTGAVAIDALLIIAVDDRILLLTPGGALIEQLTEQDGVPAGMKRVGVDRANRFVIEAQPGLFTSEDDFISWKHWHGEPGEISWAAPVATGHVLKQTLQHHYRGEVLPMERVLLDLHSGRFFGRFGPWIIDASAVLLVLLSLTGSWMWLKRRR